MRYSFIIFLISISEHLYSQTSNQIGQAKFIDTKTISVDTVLESICGRRSKVFRSTMFARTKVQLSCNYGDPSKNTYDTVTNKLYVCYSLDTTGAIYNVILNDIKNYISEQETRANRYGSGNDRTYLDFNKSFFLNGDNIVPFVSTEGENTGDYQIFYLNNQVYKIILLEGNGFGSLSSFVSQNMYFVKDNQKIDLGIYIKNIETAKQIIAKK